jgi:hypothetical protein
VWVLLHILIYISGMIYCGALVQQTVSYVNMAKPTACMLHRPTYIWQELLFNVRPVSMIQYCAKNNSETYVYLAVFTFGSIYRSNIVSWQGN